MKLVLAAALATLMVAQDPPAPEGVRATEAGVGFALAGELPNLPPTMPRRAADDFVGRRDAWSPFQVTLENTGPAVAGTLTVRPVNPTAAPMEYTKRVSLPRGTRKRLAFPICNNWVGALEVFLDDESGTRVPLNENRRLLIDQPRTVPIAARLGLVATNATGAFGHYLRLSRAGTLAGDRIVAPIRPANLPASAVELSTVSLVVLDDLPVDELTDAQQEALIQWVRRGGVLVIAAQQSASQLKGTRLESIAPGVPGPIRNVDRLAGLEAVGIPCELRSPQAVLTFTPLPGARAWGDAEAVVLESRIETGRVVMCGFPFSAPFLEAWPGAPFLFETLAGAGGDPVVPVTKAGLHRDLRQGIARSLRESVAKAIPGLGAVALILGAYLAAILVLPYVGFRLLRRLEWAWAAVLVIAAAGTAGVYGWGLRFLDTGSTAYRLTLVEGGSVAGPRLRHNFWCLFTSRGSRLSLDFEDSPMATPLGVELALRGTSGSVEPLRVAFDEDAQIRGLRTHVQDSVTFETTDTVRLPGRLEFTVKESTAEGTRGWLTGRFEVIGGFPLYEAWVVYGDAVFAVKPGEFTVGGPSLTLPRLKDRFHELTLGAALATAREASRAVPILLYRYDSPASLNDPGIQERVLHFGLLRPGESGFAPANVTWEAHCVRPFDPAEGVAEFRVVGSGLPEGWTYERILVRAEESPYPIRAFDWDRQDWRPVHEWAASAGLLRRLPQGQVLLRLQVRPPAGIRTDFTLRESGIQVHVLDLKRSGP